MSIRFPRPLVPGDRVGVTAPSSGVPKELRARLDVAVRTIEARGFEVVVGDCLDGTTHLSAPAPERARELTEMLLDPAIRAVVPPWGGETGIDVIPHLDFARLRDAQPTWVVGFSDVSTLLTPLTLVSGMATLHGNNLMDTPYRVPEGLLGWLDIVTLAPGSRFTQTPPGRHRASGWDDWVGDPEAHTYTLDTPGRWKRLDSDADLDVRGRLLGGCIETLCNLSGTPYADTTAFARAASEDGLLVYVEACEDNAFSICRNLHGMRLAGFFEGANAVLVGRTAAPDTDTLTQHEAVLDALGPLGVPILADVDCGHVPPYLPLVNGALAHVVHTPTRSEITQTLA
ncbi:LD-carboxypeptidase [Streptomyces sp. DSM 42041]|uniref:LD-carboxypeptidase n=1 Tax=Streptomyces hazeniae TaxID=3075538 RepID=A0ABU2NWN1_9ACTN|nr:LD-carboxypeptidase [Streptomyces sp. DSM 42041]MDT0380402.1 LD-carboxypeptidase [Streptomyces sp. DSM 42041]